MRYSIEGEDLCIRIPLDAFVEQAEAFEGVNVRVLDRAALAMSVGRELCDCENPYSEDLYLNKPLDDALERVIESADPSLAIGDPPSTERKSPQTQSGGSDVEANN